MSVLPPERGRELLLLLLSQIPGIGPARTNAIIARFGPDPAMLEADARAFAEVPGIGGNLAGEIAAAFGSNAWMARSVDAANRQLDRAAGLGATVLTILDHRYPELLKEIYDPPPLLFVRGNPDALSLPSIAVVGTRKASSYGRQAADQFSRDLVLEGYAVVSGLAYGIDMTAHRAAIDSGGTTCAVLGCGIDTIYTDPAGRLWPKILERGAIISEELIGTGPAPGNFPRRNRLISGLSAGTLVVESDVTGGSMITASCALDQNREVFAIPGSIYSRNSRGTNTLIQRCQAKPVHSATDIIAELRPTGAPPAAHGERQDKPDTLPVCLSREEAKILELLGEESLHIDAIAEKAGIPVADLLVHLFELELKRAVVQEAGQLFRARRSPL
ncbi:MAG: DNA-protecting protein DprA [Chlorobiaceae bacterium]|nr:DNA-protecting protein DprA [Chlorobiaceae bacterium]